MDPNIMKLLEEDEDETMHSGADVDAFTAELNRDIEEGNNNNNTSSSQQQPSDSDSAVLSQGSSQTANQFLSPWQNSDHEGITNYHKGQEVIAPEQKEHQLSQVDLQQHGSESQNLKAENDSSHEHSLPLPSNPPTDAFPKTLDEQNTFPVSQPAVMQASGNQPLHVQKAEREPDAGGESEPHKLQNVSIQQSVEMGSNSQQSTARELNDQQPLPTGKGSQHPNAGITNEQVSAVNQHATGTGMTSQPAMTSGSSNQQAMMSSNQQQGVKLNKQVPFGMLLPIIQPQLDKDRAMQLHTLYFKLKKNEISKDGFVRHMRSIVGDQMLKMAVYKLQTQSGRNSQPAPNQFQSHSQTSARQMQVSSSDFGNPTSESNAVKLREMESQADSPGLQVSQERKHPAYPTQGLNKQQPQPMHFSQTSFPTYGGGGSNYSPFSAANVTSAASLRPQTLDSQMRQHPVHQNMSVNHFGSTTQPMNLTNLSKFERPHSFNDTKKAQAGTLSHMSSNATMQQTPVQWPSSTGKEQKLGISSPMTYVKQEPGDQSSEPQKSQFSAAHGLSSLPSAQSKLGNAAPGISKDDPFEIHSSRTGLAPPSSTVSTNAVSSSIPSSMESHILSNSRMSSLTSPIGPGNNSKAPAKKPLSGQKKPMEAPSSSPPPSSKKQKVSGAFLDQSIEQLNDVTAVSGVNLREEEEQLFSGPKEESRVSEASRKVVQEEEERLILHKIPLQKKVAEIMAKSGLKNMSNDVGRCLSLCVEERMRGLITNLIRLSKQRVDIEKARHRTVITSDIRQQIMAINRKAREEWEKKQAETEKSQKGNEPENSTGVNGDKEKDENRAKSAKANKEEDDKMRTTAANVAVRAATGVDDMLSKWQLMAAAKKQGGADTPSSSQPSEDVARKSLPTSIRNTKENQEAGKRDRSTAFNTSASVRKFGRNPVVPRVARNITVKDVVAALEREPQMSKSSLIYRLYGKVKAESGGE